MNCGKLRINRFFVQRLCITFDEVKDQLLKGIFAILCVLMLLKPGGTYSQEAKRYFFSHFSTRNGLLSNHAQSIVQDEKGFYGWALLTAFSGSTATGS